MRGGGVEEWGSKSKLVNGVKGECCMWVVNTAVALCLSWVFETWTTRQVGLHLTGGKKTRKSIKKDSYLPLIRKVIAVYSQSDKCAEMGTDNLYTAMLSWV